MEDGLQGYYTVQPPSEYVSPEELKNIFVNYIFGAFLFHPVFLVMFINYSSCSEVHLVLLLNCSLQLKVGVKVGVGEGMGVIADSWPAEEKYKSVSN